MATQLKPKPVDDRVTILPDKVKTTTKHGIIIPEVAQGETTTGRVVVINEQTKQVKPGDHVVFDPRSGNAVEYKGKVYRLLRESNIIAII